jgi:hypothetical protein
MKVLIRSPRDLAAGLIFFTIGVLWMIAATRYRIGQATAMGPGYFPLAVASVLAVLGAGSVVRAFRFVDREPFGRWPIAALICVLGGVVAFALLLESVGLIAASGAVVLLCCWSRLRTRPIETAILTLALIALVSGIFVFGLGLPVDLVVER